MLAGDWSTRQVEDAVKKLKPAPKKPVIPTVESASVETTSAETSANYTPTEKTENPAVSTPVSIPHPTDADKLASVVAQFSTWRTSITSVANSINYGFSSGSDEDRAEILGIGIDLYNQIDDFHKLFQEGGLLHWLVSQEVK